MQGQGPNEWRGGFRFVTSVAPSDVGSRVSLRRSVPDGKFTDVVGVLEGWSDGVIRVRRRDGSLVEFGADTLVAGKVVPEPSRRTREPE